MTAGRTNFPQWDPAASTGPRWGRRSARRTWSAAAVELAAGVAPDVALHRRGNRVGQQVAEGVVLIALGAHQVPTTVGEPHAGAQPVEEVGEGARGRALIGQVALVVARVVGGPTTIRLAADAEGRVHVRCAVGLHALALVHTTVGHGDAVDRSGLVFRVVGEGLIAHRDAGQVAIGIIAVAHPRRGRGQLVSRVVVVARGGPVDGLRTAVA